MNPEDADLAVPNPNSRMNQADDMTIGASSTHTAESLMTIRNNRFIMQGAPSRIVEVPSTFHTNRPFDLGQPFDVGPQPCARTECEECKHEKDECTCRPCICAYCVDEDCQCLSRTPETTDGTDVSASGDTEQDAEDELIAQASQLNLASLYRQGRKTGVIPKAVNAYAF